MNITKKDVIWAYAAQFFQIASGVLVLPLILRMLSTSEIAMNYIMLNIGSLVILFDFGFSNQFSRNFSYVFSGAKKLKKTGLAITVENSDIDYHLLKTLISTARTVYRIIGFFVLLIMCTLGTWYIYKVTNGFNLVSNVLVIWLLYVVSVFFNIYYMYLNSILIGKGAIAESRKGIVYSRFVYLGVAYSLLLLRFGLVSVVIANLIAPFVQRFLLVKYFYKKEIKTELKRHTVTKKELRDCFETIWYNAKKSGAVSAGAFAINKSGLFFAGLFLSVKDIASYGLMMQLAGVINAVSTTMFTIHQPVFAGYRVHRDQAGLLKDLSLTAGIFYFLFVLCALSLIILGNPLLLLIKSNGFLPDTAILVLYLAVVLLEQNHSFFSVIIASNNIIPYVKPALVSGFFIIAGTYMILKFTNFGLLGMILVQGVVQLCYNNWKWPMVVCKELETSFRGFVSLSCRETVIYCREGLNGLNRFFKK